MLDVQFLQVQQCLICNTDWFRFGNYIWSFRPGSDAELFMMKSSWWKVQHLNQSRSKGTPKVKFLAGLGEKNDWVVPNWNRHLNRALYMLQFKESEALFFSIDSLFICTNQSTTTSTRTFIGRLYIRKMKFISNKN